MADLSNGCQIGISEWASQGGGIQTQPPGFEMPNSENKVCKLKKALYGLKQAPRAWNKRIDNFLRSIDFKQCASDASMYVKMKCYRIGTLTYPRSFEIGCKVNVWRGTVT